jgi:hypothetical protein
LRDVAERGVLGYAVLDARDGSLVASRFTTLPAPARVLVDERLGERFELEPLPGGNRFAWAYTQETVPGAILGDADRPVGRSADEGVEPAPSQIVLSGTVTIDVGSGQASVAVDERAGASMPRAALETRESPELGGRRFLSAAGTHLVASERSGAEAYRWRVHARGGARLGEVVLPWAYLPFAVVGESLVVATPLHMDRRGDEVEISPVAIESIELSSGRSRWRRPIRDTAYRGPYPH